MQKFIINGKKKLNGELNVHGAKNSVLPILAATILCDSQCIIHNCPDLSDVKVAINILKYLGCKVEHKSDTIIVEPNLSKYEIPDDMMRSMRSSIIFLGAILSRFGKAKLSFPGGCELGPRPIDIHLKALTDIGMVLKEECGILDCCLNNDRFTGAKIMLPFPSVGATENIILASVLADGNTTIINAAREPEICDLSNFLNKCGAKISGAGTGTIEIEGVKKLLGTEHNVIPDRIEATTLMACACVTNGTLTLNDILLEHMNPVLSFFEDIGCKLKPYNKNRLKINAPAKLKATNSIIKTMPYPGFPTDAQAIIMSVTSLNPGTDVFVENIFESRYRHVDELIRLGADINIEGRVAIVRGVKKLYGNNVSAYELRGAAALVIAGLAAEGTTRIEGIKYLDRGYENLDKSLKNIGASIKRE